MTAYRRTQFGTFTVVSVAAAIAVLLLISASTDLHAVSIAVLVVLVIALALFYSLTIDVNDRKFLCFFGLGLVRRTFLLTEVVAARRVRNRWYYGWGIRLTSSGWMFNVSGFDAVELELISGTRFRIGTDRPDEVVQAIQQARGLVV